MGGIFAGRNFRGWNFRGWNFRGWNFPGTEKIIPINIDFLIFCSEIHDAEKYFDSEVTAGLSKFNFNFEISTNFKEVYSGSK